jgi:2-iminobutanoate/2-iminopropanoate deaminase
MRKSHGVVILATLLLLALGGCSSSGPLKQAIRPATGGSPLFSPVVRTGNLLFLSGVIGRSPNSDDIGVATRSALDQVRDRLTSVGSTMADVVKCTVFLVDMADYDGMNRVYVEYFPSDPPARTAIAVRELPVNAEVEIECIAVTGGR